MPNSDSKTYIVNDQPTERDALDFTPYVETLADIIQTGNTPLTIGVFGTWGSGKTSLMKMVKNQLPDDFTVAWFDAWKYDKEDSLWRAFLLCVLTALKERASLQGKPVDEFEKLQSLLYREMEIEKVGGVTIDLAKIGGVAAKSLAQLTLSFIPGIPTLTKLVEELQSGAAKNVDDATAAIQRERTKIYIEQIQFLEQFQKRFSELIQEHVQPNRLVVFVDDLDRCLPEKAIEVLEAIKLFLDAENCVFVLGLDQEVIARGIEMKYKELGEKQDGDESRRFTIEGVRYLEKIVQLPFQIPPVEQTDMGEFVEGLSAEWPHEECPNVFAEGLNDVRHNNPRQIKRAVNVFLMLWNLAKKRKEKLADRVKPIRLAKVVAIQIVHPRLYDVLKETPRYLGELERYYRAESSQERKMEKGESPLPSGEGKGGVLSESKYEGRVEPPPELVPYLSLRGILAVRRILLLHKSEMQDANFAGLPLEELKLYFTLTRRAESPQPTPLPAEAARLVFEPQMVRIPAGKFLMGSTKEQAAQAIKDGADKDWIAWEQPQHMFELSDYFIGKYPITNREYQAFLRDVKEQTPPRGWDGDQFPADKGSHPVVNVSWDDANAYCKWLNEKTKKNYRLPTEAEWEKAARGEDERVYPWGNDFDPKKANTSESKIGDTTDVGKFSNADPAQSGDSPYACADMAGNVWEWCNDWFDGNEYKLRQGSVVKDPQGPQKGTFRVLRGGSFSSYHWVARCAYRLGNFPVDSSVNRGFRVVSSPIISP